MKASRPPEAAGAVKNATPLQASTVGSDAAPKARRGADLVYLRRLWPYLSRQRAAFVTALVLYPLNALCLVLPPFLMQQMFDRGLRQNNLPLLWTFAGAYAAATVADYATGFFAEYLTSRVGGRAMAALRRDLFAHVQKLPASYFSHVPVGRLLTRMTSDVEALGEMFSTGAVTMLSDMLSVVAVVSMMLYLSAKLTLASFFIVPLLIGTAIGFQGYARRAFQEIRRQLARINAFVAEHVGAMDMVQAFGQQLRTQREFADHNEAYRVANHRAIFADAALFAIVEAIGTAAVAATIGWGAHDLASGSLTAGVLVAFIQYIRRFFVPIRDLSTKYTVLQSAFAAAERTFGLLDAEVSIQDAEGAQAHPVLERDLVLENVWFRFAGAGAEAAADNATGKPDGAAIAAAQDATAAANADDASRWVLRNVNLTVRKGERVALVGATGSGKTTLLSLLNRTHDVQRGAVKIDGHDVRGLQLHDVRRIYAPVLQDSTLFSGTLLDNLMLSDRTPRERVERALDIVQARPLVESLPRGLDTQVAELGANFSAGERQVLSLARTIALGAEVLLMDEATSNVDTPTEARMQAAIDRLLEGHTAIIVAHRLSTIEKVDRIVVLDRGEIVQQGSHAELMAAGGAYARLVREGLGAPAAAPS